MCVCVRVMACAAVDGLWVVSWGHDLRMDCYWVSVVPPKPWPSLSSNGPPPPEDPLVHTHTHTHTHTRISRHRTPCFINAPPLLPTVHLYPSLFFPVFSNLCSLCFLLSFQCNMSTHGQRGECWCVNPLTGVQIPETPKVRGDPNCNQFQEELRAMPTATSH